VLYFLIFLIHFPILFVYRAGTIFSSKGPSTDLLIQTAKLGDCLNTSPLIQVLGHIDIVCSNDCAYLFSRYKNVRNVYSVDQFKSRGILGKLTLSYSLFINRYRTAYILQPNSLNLFLSLMAKPGVTKILFPTYRNNWLTRFLCNFSACTAHTKSDLTIDTYLKMSEKKHASRNKLYPSPRPPTPEIATLINPGQFTIGIALSAGNKLKELPASLVCQLTLIFKEEIHKNYILLFFGVKGEENKLKELESSGCLEGITYRNIIGKIDLDEAAWMLSRIQLFISSDTALSYLADSFHIPLINFMGPCNWKEQRPLGKDALVVKNEIAPFSFTFNAPYHSDTSNEKLYKITNSNKTDIKDFLRSISDRGI